MNGIDFFLLLIVGLSVWSGWRNGFIAGALNLITWVGSLVIGFLAYPYVTEWLERYTTSLGAWTKPVAFLSTVVVVRLLLAFVSDRLLRSFSRESHTSGANRFFGLVPGAVNGLLYATLVAALLLAFPVSEGVSKTARDSKMAQGLAEQVAWLDDKAEPVLGEAVRRTGKTLTLHPKPNETVKLPFTVADPALREDLEAQMLRLVNKERAEHGLPPVKADPEMARVARAHSTDMFARGYFAHYTPEGDSPFDRMRRARVRYTAAGENLALAHALITAHTGLMNSPGHRANILNKRYGRLGIGVLDGGIRGLMITQNFRN